MRFGIVVFPGSNCEVDCHYVLSSVMKQDVDYVWHSETNVSKFDCVVLPGGFSYGDYLRTGAISKISPVMESVKKFAADGGLVIGICNGFQILTEAGLLEGVLLRNNTLKFMCKYINVRVENSDTPWTYEADKGKVLRIPVAHNEGAYYADDRTLRDMEANGMIVLRYCDMEGNSSDETNPNGSAMQIAGICNRKGNVFGLMPHPERASESALGSVDGRIIFESVINWYER